MKDLARTWNAVGRLPNLPIAETCRRRNTAPVEYVPSASPHRTPGQGVSVIWRRSRPVSAQLRRAGKAMARVASPERGPVTIEREQRLLVGIDEARRPDVGALWSRSPSSCSSCPGWGWN
jgi:hypothetical protein